MSNPARQSSPEVGPTRQQLDELDALLQRMLDLPVSQDDALEPEPEPPPRPAPRSAAPPAPTVPTMRYFDPDNELDDEEDDSPPPGYPPTSTMVGAYLSPGPELAPRVVSPPAPTPTPPPPRPLLEPPVPGGRHSLEPNHPIDPTEELARIRAQMQQRASLPPTAHIPNPPDVDGDWVPLRSSWQPSAQTWKPLAEHWEQAKNDTPQPPDNAPRGPVVLTQTATDSEHDLMPPAPRFNAPQPPPTYSSPPGSAPTKPAEPPRTPWPLLPLVWFNVAFDVLLLPWCPRGKFLRGSARSFLGVMGILCMLGAAALAVCDWFGLTW